MKLTLRVEVEFGKDYLFPQELTDDDKRKLCAEAISSLDKAARNIVKVVSKSYVKNHSVEIVGVDK